MKTLPKPLLCESKNKHKKENEIMINQPHYGVTNTLPLASLYPVYVSASLPSEATWHFTNCAGWKKPFLKDS